MLFGPISKKDIKNNRLGCPKSVVLFGQHSGQGFFRAASTGTTVFLAVASGCGTLSISNQRGNWFGCSVKREDKTSKVYKPSSGAVLAAVPTDGGLLFGESHDKSRTVPSS